MMATPTLRGILQAPRLPLWACCALISGLAFALIAGERDALAALCRALPAGSFLANLAMWLVMTLAMMVPSAAPMIATYLDIADAAAGKEMRIASAGFLAGGYGLVWAGFSLAMAALQGGLSGPWPSWLPGLALIGAGLYQFTALKRACLSKCRSPMAYFLARWSERPSRVLGMGVEQGLHCLGCCWALMALGLISGLMNPVWMAAVAVLAIVEKTLPEPRPVVYGAGAGLTTAGAVLLMAG
jgi:predicted metal-binding membrane protein